VNLDANEPAIEDIAEQAAAPEVRGMWRDGLTNILFAAGVAAVGLFVSSVLVGVAHLWWSIRRRRQERETWHELRIASNRRAELEPTDPSGLAGDDASPRGEGVRDASPLGRSL
jgi:hypothetical protein